MRAPFIFGLAASVAVGIAPAASSAQAQTGPYPSAPYVQQGAYPPYPTYPPPSYAPPPAYPPPPGYVQPAYGPSPRIKYQEGMVTPQGYHLEESPRKGLVVAGAVVLGTTYALSAMIGASSGNTDDRWLLLPMFGPFFDLAARNEHGCSSGSTATNVSCNVFDPIIKFYLAMDGIAQVAGGVLLATGFIFQKKEFVSDTYYESSARRGLVANWTVVPEVTPGARYGLMLRGELF